MPKKSKQSKAALKGWATRRKNERKRSAIAKKGWETRRKNERKKVKEPTKKKAPPRKKKPEPVPPPRRKKAPPEGEVITRRTYKPKGVGPRGWSKMQIVSRGPLKEDFSNIIRLTIRKNTYTRRKDIEKLYAVLRASS